MDIDLERLGSVYIFYTPSSVQRDPRRANHGRWGRAASFSGSSEGRDTDAARRKQKDERRTDASRAGLSIDVFATGVTCIPRLEGYLICTSARCLQTPHSLGPKTTRGSRYRMSTSSTSTTSTIDGMVRVTLPAFSTQDPRGSRGSTAYSSVISVRNLALGAGIAYHSLTLGYGSAGWRIQHFSKCFSEQLEWVYC